MFGEFRIGKGLVLLCQPDFDESEVALSEHVLAHLAVQLLSPPGQLLLEAESSR